MPFYASSRKVHDSLFRRRCSTGANAMTSIPLKTIGLLLAGGKSVRMGGGDKCLLSLGGRPILSHVIERAQPQVDQLLLNINSNEEAFSSFDLPRVHDSYPTAIGPLGGIHAGLRWMSIRTPTAEWLATFATDSPFFPTTLVETLVASAVSSGSRIILAKDEQGTHPTFGLWHASLLGDLHRELQSSASYSVKHVAKRLGAQSVRIPNAEPHAFMNINTPTDRQSAEQQLELGHLERK
jgi:molybdopterin-guanine dinucleotide biosynthesis protein A